MKRSRLAFFAAVLAAVLAACSARRATRGGMVPVADLPAAYRELWSAWVARDPAWPALRAAALADPPRARFLVENLARELVAGFVSGDLSAGHVAASGGYDRARAELLVIGAPAAPVLAELLALGDGAAAHACGELLAALEGDALAALVPLLAREEPRARERAALVLADLPNAGDGEAPLRAELARLVAHDPEWNVRAAAVRAVAARGARDQESEPARATLCAALGDGDALVAREAALGLGRLGDRAAIPALINHLERCERSADLPGRNACLTALENLSGTHGRRRPEEWRAWWRGGGARE